MQKSKLLWSIDTLCFSCHQVRVIRRKVEEGRSAMETNKSRGKVLEFIMNLKTSGTLPGVAGRLVCHDAFSQSINEI